MLLLRDETRQYRLSAHGTGRYQLEYNKQAGHKHALCYPYLADRCPVFSMPLFTLVEEAEEARDPTKPGLFSAPSPPALGCAVS